MAVSKIDWVVMWKLFHYHFFWMYATIGIPLRFALVVRRFKMAPARKTRIYVVMSSLASSLLCTWFPIVPIIFGAVLMLAAGDAAGHAVGESPSDRRTPSRVVNRHRNRNRRCRALALAAERICQEAIRAIVHHEHTERINCARTRLDVGIPSSANLHRRFG